MDDLDKPSPLWSLETAFVKEDTAVIFTLFPLSHQCRTHKEASGEQQLMFPILITLESASPNWEYLGRSLSTNASFAALQRAAFTEEAISCPAGRRRRALSISQPPACQRAAGRDGCVQAGDGGQGKEESESRRKCGAANMHPNTKQPEDARIRKWDTLLFHKLS